MPGGFSKIVRSLLNIIRSGLVEEIMLWMLLSCLASYLSLSEQSTPCFNGKPDSDMYRDAIMFVLEGRKSYEFSPETYIEGMLS